MHRLTVTITAPSEIEGGQALTTFADHLLDMADDIAALPPQNHAFGAFGGSGCKLYYRVEMDDARSRVREGAAR